MFFLHLNDHRHIPLLLEVTSILAGAAPTADLQCSPSMFSLMVSSPSAPFIVTLQITSQYFDQFFSNGNHHFSICLPSFMAHMKMGGPSSLTLTLAEPLNRLLLEFINYNAYRWIWELAFSQPESCKYGGEIDYSTFVSIDSELCRWIAAEFNISPVLVTLRNSKVTFSVPLKEIRLTKWKGHCIIGGVAAREKIQFLINFNPIQFFQDLTYRSRRVWLFKATDSHCILNAPISLAAGLMIYFPRSAWTKV